MALKKVATRSLELEDDDNQAVAVMLEPYPGYSDEEVADKLRQAGAQEVEVLAAGFISAQATPSALRAVEQLADIHRKPRKQIRRAGQSE